VQAEPNDPVDLAGNVDEKRRLAPFQAPKTKKEKSA
jgi:hypothetical protein